MSTEPHQDSELRTLFEQLCQAWTSGDAEAYGRCFTDDSDYVSFDGTLARGRSPMVANHDRLFRGVLQRSSLVGDVESIRYLRPDVALLHTTGSVQMPWRSSVPRRRRSRQTIVALRTEGGGGSPLCRTAACDPSRFPAPTRCLRGCRGR